MSEAKDLVWIEKTNTTTRIYMFRTRYGMHYEGTIPVDPSDIELMHRDERHTSGWALGSHPELGDVYAAADQLVKTLVHPTYDLGKWRTV